MANENKAGKNDTVGLFLQAMVDREPGKRKVKPSKAALVDLAELDLGESSDDSDFHVDEAKLNDDDDVSINSDPDAQDDDDDDDDEEDDSDGGEGEDDEDGDIAYGSAHKTPNVTQLLEQAKQKQALEAERGFERPKILVCAVCLGDHSDDLNEIVTCDGCSVSVHEGCYGISDSVSVSSTVSSCSTEPWFCDACKAGVDNPPCELCPNLGYTIFKETEMGRWVHLVCALYIPGVAFSEVDKLSFPTLFEMPYSRWGAKTCILCEDERYSRTGVCIGCDAGMCRAYFHVTCAQREGLLSEVNHGEADQADPYYAHCKLHTDRELIRRRKRNWLALQLHMKQGEADKSGSSQETQDRIQRKLARYRDKYLFNKNNRPTPWYPTQKMPRALSTSASLFRSLLHKTELMGISTETQPQHSASVGDIRKKWHIPPAFNVEFISYYLDRTNRLTEMKDRLDHLLTENSQLVQEEAQLRLKCRNLESDCELMKSDNEVLLNKALELHDLLKGLAGRPLPLPPVVAALHNPPSPPMPTQPLPKGSLRGPIITKAAAKMMGDQTHPRPGGECWPPQRQDVGGVGGMTHLHGCRVCHSTREQHLLIECDTCGNHYHLSCLDPPLTRMPKKTKQMGWQCSDCCKSSDSDKAPEVDMAAPRRLRRNIKEPAKFSPSIVSEPKIGCFSSRSINIEDKKTMTTMRQGEIDRHEFQSDTDIDFEGFNDEPNIYNKQLQTKGLLYEKQQENRSLQQCNISPVSESTEKTIGNVNNCGSGLSGNNETSVGNTEETPPCPHLYHPIVSPTVPPTVAATTPTTPTTSSSPGPATKRRRSTDKKTTKTKKRRKSQGAEDEVKDEVKNEETNMDTAAAGITQETRTGKGKKGDILPAYTSTLATTTTTTTTTTTSTTPIPDTPAGKSTRRGQNTDLSVTDSPSKSRRGQTDPPTFSASPQGTDINKRTEEKPSAQLASPTRTRRHQSEVSEEPPGELESIPHTCQHTHDVPENTRHRTAATIHLDTSVESLPSASSLHSPTSESFHSAEDDPTSPRKEKRHRDGSKKKKKDKDKELEGGRKRKKHHHRDKHGLGEMASEIVTPFRIKIKPLPPRPTEENGSGVTSSTASSHTHTSTPAVSTHSQSSTTPTTYTSQAATSSSSSSSSVTSHTKYQTTTAPAGYPPLPPGYTLTQPMAPPSTSTPATSSCTYTPASVSSSTHTSSTFSTTTTTSTSSVTTGPGRRRSDPGDPQQFSKCDVCGETGGVTNTVSCDECNKAYHFNCLEPPLKKSPKRRGYSWFCEDCDNAT